MKALKLFSMKLSAAVIGGFTAGLASLSAHAQDLDDIVDTTAQNLVSIPSLITGVTYIGGAVLVIGGVLQLKKHVDQPSQEDMRKGLVRLVAGAFLLAAPTAFNVLLDTTNLDGSGNFNNQQFQDINL